MPTSRQLPSAPPPSTPPRPPATPTWQQFGVALKQLRKWSELSIPSLDRKYPLLRRSTISEYERGTRKPRWEWVHAFVTACLTHANYRDHETELTHWQTAWNNANQPLTGDTPQHDKPWQRQLPIWAIAATIAITAIAGVLAATTTGLFNNHDNSSTVSPTSSMSAPGLTTVNSPPYVPGKTYTQIANSKSSNGPNTYKNPHALKDAGENIPNHTSVEVSCKVIARSAPSVGIYWYRIASPPWKNQYYSPSNSFLNSGDGGPNDRDVDPNVPDCPQ